MSLMSAAASHSHEALPRPPGAYLTTIKASREFYSVRIAWIWPGLPIYWVLHPKPP